MITSRAAKRSLRLPAAAECAVEPHDREEFVSQELGKLQLGVEELALGVEDLEVAGDAAAIADVRQPRGVEQGVDERFLLNAGFGPLAVLDEGIRDVTECLLDRLLVADQGPWARASAESTPAPTRPMLKMGTFICGPIANRPVWPNQSPLIHVPPTPAAPVRRTLGK